MKEHPPYPLHYPINQINRWSTSYQVYAEDTGQTKTFTTYPHATAWARRHTGRVVITDQATPDKYYQSSQARILIFQDRKPIKNN